MSDAEDWETANGWAAEIDLVNEQSSVQQQPTDTGRASGVGSGGEVGGSRVGAPIIVSPCKLRTRVSGSNKWPGAFARVWKLSGKRETLGYGLDLCQMQINECASEGVCR